MAWRAVQRTTALRHFGYVMDIAVGEGRWRLWVPQGRNVLVLWHTVTALLGGQVRVAGGRSCSCPAEVVDGVGFALRVAEAFARQRVVAVSVGWGLAPLARSFRSGR